MESVKAMAILLLRDEQQFLVFPEPPLFLHIFFAIFILRLVLPRNFLITMASVIPFFVQGSHRHFVHN